MLSDHSSLLFFSEIYILYSSSVMNIINGSITLSKRKLYEASTIPVTMDSLIYTKKWTWVTSSTSFIIKLRISNVFFWNFPNAIDNLVKRKRELNVCWFWTCEETVPIANTEIHYEVLKSTKINYHVFQIFNQERFLKRIVFPFFFNNKRRFEANSACEEKYIQTNRGKSTIKL